MSDNKLNLAGQVANLPGPNMPITGAGGMWTGVVVGGLILTFSAVHAVKKAREENEEE